MARKLKDQEKAILDWVKTNQPDLIDVLDLVFDSKGAYLPALRPLKTIYIMLLIGFDAGRKFQRDNPDAPEDLDYDDFTCV